MQFICVSYQTGYSCGPGTYRVRANIKRLYCGACQDSRVSDFVALGDSDYGHTTCILSFFFIISWAVQVHYKPRKWRQKRMFFISTFCAPPFRGFPDLSALQTSPLYSIGSQLLPLPFLWLCILPLDSLQGVLLDLTEPYNHREVQMKQIHIYVLWAKYFVSTKFTYWDPNPNALVWEVGTLKGISYEREALTQRISVLTMRGEALRTLLSPPSIIKNGQCKMERSPGAGTLISDVHSPKLQEIRLCCLYIF